MIKPITYEQVGHEPHPEGFEALSPDYIEDDIGNYKCLSATVFGYQIDEESAIKMINFLSGFVLDSMESRRKQEENK